MKKVTLPDSIPFNNLPDFNAEACQRNLIGRREKIILCNNTKSLNVIYKTKVIMKRSIRNFLPLNSRKDLSHLKFQVSEPPGIPLPVNKVKMFSVADLWNIHKQKRPIKNINI